MGFSHENLVRTVEDALEGTMEDLLDFEEVDRQAIRQLARLDRSMHRDLDRLAAIVHENVNE